MNASFSSTISKTNPNIMEYLAQKLEAKSKGMIYNKQLLGGIYDMQGLNVYKKNIIGLLSEMEDDLKQASYAIKGLFIENKALTMEIDQLKERLYVIEDNYQCYNKGIEESHDRLMAENAELKEQLMMYRTNAINSEMVNNNNNDNNRSSEYQKHLRNITEENELEIPIKKMHTQESEGCNSNSIRQSDSKRKGQVIESNSNKIDSGLNNVKNIISDMKINKRKLKEAIKNYTQDHQLDSRYDLNDSNEVDDGENNGEVNEGHAINYTSFDQSDSRNDKYNGINKKQSFEILMRLLGNPENINILNKQLGKDFMQKMLRNDCPEDYLMKIKSILDERTNCSRKSKRTLVNKDKDKDKDKDKKPMRIRNCKSRPNSKSLPKKLMKSDKDINNNYKCRSLSSSYIKPAIGINQSDGSGSGVHKVNSLFENTLRDYSKNSLNKTKKIKKKTSNTAEPKPKFNHYLNPYGKYFTNPINDQNAYMNIKVINK